MSTPVSRRRYFSPVIKANLLVGDRSLRIAQVAPDYVVLQTATTLPAGPAALVIDVEGDLTRREIDLPHGAQVDSPRVPIVRR